MINRKLVTLILLTSLILMFVGCNKTTTHQDTDIPNKETPLNDIDIKDASNLNNYKTDRITISTSKYDPESGKLLNAFVEIKDPKTIKEIVDICSPKGAITQLTPEKSFKSVATTWIDFNNGFVIGLYGDAFGFTSNVIEDWGDNDAIVPDNLYDYVTSLLNDYNTKSE